MLATTNVSIVLMSSNSSLDWLKDKLEIKQKKMMHSNESGPIHAASLQGHIEIVQFLVQNGANIEALGTWDETPLHLAAENGHLETAKFLIQNGANVDAIMGWKRTPLHFAAENGHQETVKFLIQNGANVDAIMGWKRTPLHFAAENGHQETAKFLIQNGANIDAFDDRKRTPLHYAAENGHLETVKCLIQNGHNVDVLDSWAMSPLIFATENGHLETATFLIQSGANAELLSGHLPLIDKKHGTYMEHTLLSHAAKNEDQEMVKFLIQNGTNIDAFLDDKTLLHLAAQSRDIEMVQYLIQNGANVNVVDYDHNTPLHFAAGNQHLEMIQYLLDCGAIIYTNTHGETIFDLADKHNHQHYSDILRIATTRELIEQQERYCNKKCSGNGRCCELMKEIMNACNASAAIWFSSQSGISIFGNACTNNHENFFKELIEKIRQQKLTLTNLGQPNPVWLACYENNEKMLLFLLENKDVLQIFELKLFEESAPDGTTALMISVAKENKKIIDILKSNGIFSEVDILKQCVKFGKHQLMDEFKVAHLNSSDLREIYNIAVKTGCEKTLQKVLVIIGSVAPYLVTGSYHTAVLRYGTTWPYQCLTLLLRSHILFYTVPNMQNAENY